MKRRSSIEQPLFDFEEPEATGFESRPCPDTHGRSLAGDADGLNPSGSDLSTWQEVPAARFLSWTRREQLAYCAARDEDSAAHEASPEWQLFYLERAAAYLMDLQGS